MEGMEAWRHGANGGMEGMETWREWRMEAWRHGGMEAWREWRHGGNGGMEGMEAIEMHCVACCYNDAMIRVLPMLAFLSAGASFTPSPVTATTKPAL